MSKLAKTQAASTGKTTTKNRAAAALSKLGASKGGTERAKALSPERRKEIARKAIAARWEKARNTK